MPGVYAHRGVSAGFPENTLPAFARALELEVEGIELDVHLSADGVPVVIHDETVDRTTDGSGSVANLTAAQLAELDAGNGEPVPTLAQVLDLVAGHLHVDIEVKAAEAADAALALARARLNLRFAISSFNHDVLRHVRRVDAMAELWPLTAAVSDEVLETARDLGSPRIAVYDRMLNEEIMQAVAAAGLGVWVWTVNDPERAAELVRYGAVGICTDDPAAILPLIRQEARHAPSDHPGGSD